MASNKKKKHLPEPFVDNFDRMTNPVKRLLAGIKKEDLEFSADDVISSASTEQPQTTRVLSTQVDTSPEKSTRVDPPPLIITPAIPAQEIIAQAESATPNLTQAISTSPDIIDNVTKSPDISLKTTRVTTAPVDTTRVESSPTNTAQVVNAEVVSNLNNSSTTFDTQANTTRVESTRATITQVTNKASNLKDTHTQKDAATSDTQAEIARLESTRVEITGNYLKLDLDILNRALMELTTSEFVTYIKLYQLSYGRNTSICRMGRGKLTKITNLKSDKTAQVALAGLVEKGYIKPIDEGRLTPQGTLYRVNLPQEINHYNSDTRVNFTQAEITRVDNSTE